MVPEPGDQAACAGAAYARSTDTAYDRHPQATLARTDLTLHSLPPGTEDGVSVPERDGHHHPDRERSAATRSRGRCAATPANPLNGKIAEEAEDHFPLRPVGRGEYEYKGKAFSARITRDGRVSFDDKNIRDFRGLSGGFDVTDPAHEGEASRSLPRREARAFMTYTDAMRKKMAQAALKERQTASLEHLPEHLDDIWRNRAHPAEARRQEIYEMWLDAAMSEAETGDAAKEACNIVETYVRRYLPADSADAFTEDELEKLNRGKHYKFAPYR